MTRSAFLAPVLLATVATSSACKPPKTVKVDARELVPAAANAAFGFELDPVRSSPLAEPMATAVGVDPDGRAMIEKAGDCIELSGLRAMFAGSLEQAEDRFVSVVESPGIGEEDSVRCIEKILAEADGKDPGLIAFDKHDGLRVLPQEGGGFEVLLNDDAVLLMSTVWSDETFASLTDASKRNTTSALAKAVAAIDPGTDAWFAYAPSAADLESVADLEGADGVEALVGQLDLTDGADLELWATTKDEASATKLQATLQQLLEASKPNVTDAGLPADFLDQAKLTSEGTRVSFSLPVSAAALPKVITTVTPLFAE